MKYPSVEDLFQEILKARQRVYEIACPTPLHRLSPTENLFIKREDLSSIHAYKWRGAYNRMSLLSDEEKAQGVVCASAGNHAQGVALAAQKLRTRAEIFMPRSTPMMKQKAVRTLGGDAANVRLEGDSYDDASKSAHVYSQETGKTFIHPYDDLMVMAGQGTLADEIVMSGEGDFDIAYLQIGGGGMAAGVACWLKRYYPNIEIVGVEGEDQASMAAAVKNGEPIELDYLDVFCDGTAVKKAGQITRHFCEQLVDRFISVTNDEVCAAIQMLWESQRLIPEPAGAMGMAGWLKEKESVGSKRALAIICGSNMDFGQLSYIVRHAGIGSAHRRYYRFRIPERSGALLHLLETFLDSVNIIEFQHGLTGEDMACPVIGIDAMPNQFAVLEEQLKNLGIEFEDATGDEDVEFRIIRYDASLIKRPCFIKIEFPERAGALHDFLQDSCKGASIVYFNYSYTGERVGRAMIGFDFESNEDRDAFRKRLAGSETVLRDVREVSPEALDRMV
ncbi:MAG: threonine ammonia-lyase, biosynthetic [Opitutales bacterium]